MSEHISRDSHHISLEKRQRESSSNKKSNIIKDFLIDYPPSNKAITLCPTGEQMKNSLLVIDHLKTEPFAK